MIRPSGHDVDTVALLACRRSSEREGAGAVLEDLGYQVLLADTVEEVLAAVSSVPVGVVVVGAEHDRDHPGQPLAHAITGRGPGCEVVVIHADDDVVGMWRSLRTGALPCRGPVDQGLRFVLSPRRTDGSAVALEALHHELLGCSADACEAMSRLSAPDGTLAAIEELSSAGARALERLHGRSRFLVPTDLLVDRIPAHLGDLDADGFSLWWTMFQAITFRAAGLQLPVRELDLESRHLGALFGAFHATSVILQFTARRQWRQPTELLGELLGAGRGGRSE